MEEGPKKKRHRAKSKRRKKARIPLNMSPLKSVPSKGLFFYVKDPAWINDKCFDSTMKKNSETIMKELFGPTNVEKIRLKTQEQSQFEKAWNYLDSLCSRLFKKWKTFNPCKAVNEFLPKMEKESCGQLIRKHVTSNQLFSYIYKGLLLYFFPETLLGKNNTKLLARKLTRCFMNIRKEDVLFPPQFILKKLKSSKIEWIQGVHDKDKKIIMKNIVRFMTMAVYVQIKKWLFYVADSTNVVRFYRRDVWRRIEANSLEKFVRDRKAVPIEGIIPSYHYKLKFVPKTDSVRPIESLTKSGAINNKEKQVKRDELRMTRKALDYLMYKRQIRQGFGMGNIKKFAPIVRMFASRVKADDSGFYCWSGDFRNCFPCIDHGVLDKALKLIVPTDCRLTAAIYWGSIGARRTPRIFVGQTEQEIAQKVANYKCFIDPKKAAVRTITTAQIFQHIKEFATNTVVRYGKNCYVCHHGIAQGSSLSTILCNIYLAYVEQQLFHQNQEADLQMRNLMGSRSCLFRYVDDYLFIGRKASVAEAVLLKLLTEAQKYGMIFNGTKTAVTSNLKMLKNDVQLSQVQQLKEGQLIPWCGFKINSKNLSYTIDDSRFATRRLRKGAGEPGKRIARINWIENFLKSAIMFQLRAIQHCHRLFEGKHERRRAAADIYRATVAKMAHYYRRRLRIKKGYQPFRDMIKSLRKWISRYYCRNRFKSKMNIYRNKH